MLVNTNTQYTKQICQQENTVHFNNLPVLNIYQYFFIMIITLLVLYIMVISGTMPNIAMLHIKSDRMSKTLKCCHPVLLYQLFIKQNRILRTCNSCIISNLSQDHVFGKCICYLKKGAVNIRRCAVNTKSQ